MMGYIKLYKDYINIKIMTDRHVSDLSGRKPGRKDGPWSSTSVLVPSVLLAVSADG